MNLPIFKVSLEIPGKNISIVATNMAITTDLGDCNNTCISVQVKDDEKEKTVAIKEIIPNESLKNVLTLIYAFLTKLQLPMDLLGIGEDMGDENENKGTLSFIDIIKNMDFKLSDDAEEYLDGLPEEANLIMSAILLYVLILNIGF